VGKTCLLTRSEFSYSIRLYRHVCSSSAGGYVESCISEGIEHLKIILELPILEALVKYVLVRKCLDLLFISRQY